MRNLAGRLKSWRGWRNDNSAVTEILGDILLLTVSVALISILAVQVTSIPPPAKQTSVDLMATFDGRNVTIEHQGGIKLSRDVTQIIIVRNEESAPVSYMYNITDGHPDYDLSVGEKWVKDMAGLVNPTDSIRLRVVYTKEHRLILDQLLQKGPDLSALPDIGLSQDDIVASDYNPNKGVQITVTVNFTNVGKVNIPANNLFIKLFDQYTPPGGTTAVKKQLAPNGGSNPDFTDISGGAGTLMYTKPFNAGQKNITNWKWSSDVIGTHYITAQVYLKAPYEETRLDNNYASRSVMIGQGIVTGMEGVPDVEIFDITVDPANPVHGQKTKITVELWNKGGKAANATVDFYDLFGVSSTKIDTRLVPVAAGGLSTTFTSNWTASPGGTHTIRVVISNVDPADGNPGVGKVGNEVVSVLATILIVDDDRASPGTSRDAVTYMEAALQAIGFRYTVARVTGGDGPQYDSGDTPLKNYDVAVWLTGYETANTLTAGDQTNLKKFLDNNGSLWMISQGVINDLGAGNTFLSNYFKLTGATVNAGTPNPVNGTTDPRSPTYGMEFATGGPAGMDPGDGADYITFNGQYANATFQQKGAANYVALRINGSTGSLGAGNGIKYKLVFFSFEFARILDPNDRAILAYKIMEWFNTTPSMGKDVAVSKLTFFPPEVKYMDEVEINVVVRNNGLDPESGVKLRVWVSGKGFVPVSLRLNGVPVSPLPTTTDEINITNLPGKGGWVNVSVNWTANALGNQSVYVMVDPLNDISEFDESNNELLSILFSTNIYVRYSILLVDDDNSETNGVATGLANTTPVLRGSIETLGYTYTDWLVLAACANGPNATNMSRYNAVVWNTGEAAACTLTAADQTEIVSYLRNAQGNILLVSQDLLRDLSGNNPLNIPTQNFLRNTLHLTTGGFRVGTPDPLTGVTDDPITHGMAFKKDAGLGADNAGWFQTDNLPANIFWNSQTLARANGMRYYNDTYNSRVEFLNYDFSRIGAPTQQQFLNPSLRTVFFDNLEMNPLLTGWAAGGAASSWQWGQPTNGPGASWSGLNLWATSLGGNYNNNENSWVRTPQISLFGAKSATLSFYHFYKTQKNRDGAYVEVSEDGGATWTKIGPTASPLYGAGDGGAWFPAWNDKSPCGKKGPKGSCWAWSSFNLNPWVGKNIYLRFHFNSDQNGQDVGWYFDDVTVQISDISGINPGGGADDSRAEVMYFLLRWLNQPEFRDELFVRAQDLTLSDPSPMLGAGYVIKAVVRNAGANPASAVVRFIDGTTVINTLAVYVPAGGKAAIESVWMPLYVGQRQIRVLVDPDNMLSEVFKHNNFVTTVVPTYFFYDNVEGGTGNFKHAAIVLDIADNGAPDPFQNIANSFTAIDPANFQGPTWFWDTTSYHTYGQSLRINTNAYNNWGPGYYKTATTAPFDTRNYASATLSMWVKRTGLMLGDEGVWVEFSTNGMAWVKIYPRLPYGSNVDTGINVLVPAWSSTSSGGMGGWDYQAFDLSQVAGWNTAVNARVRMVYRDAGRGQNAGGVFWVDDLRIEATNNGANTAQPVMDLWRVVSKNPGDPEYTNYNNRLNAIQITKNAYSGNKAWWAGDISTAYYWKRPSGQASPLTTLTTVPVDLSRAKSARLDFMIRYNIEWGYQCCAGNDIPDGLRIGVSIDNGQSWFGLHSRWAGEPSHPNPFPCIGSGPVEGVYRDWRAGSTITSAFYPGQMAWNLDLSGFRGYTVLVQFFFVAGVTNTYGWNCAVGQSGGQPYQQTIAALGNDGFGGTYLDDILVTGETTTGQRAPDSPLTPEQLKGIYSPLDTPPPPGTYRPEKPPCAAKAEAGAELQAPERAADMELRLTDPSASTPTLRLPEIAAATVERRVW